MIPHQQWVEPMRLALQEARDALGTGDVPIGAVVLDPGGEVIGRGRNVREAVGDPTGPAQGVALPEAPPAVGGCRVRHG